MPDEPKVTAEELEDPKVEPEKEPEPVESENPDIVSDIAPDINPEEEVEVPVRKSVEQHIISRQKRTIEKLRSREEDEGVEESPYEDSDMLSPSAKSAVDRAVEKRIAPIVEVLASRYDDDDINALMTQEPAAKKYEKRIRSYMGHPQYKGVPAAVIYHHLAYKDSQAVLVERKAVADTEAAQMKSAGTSRRGKARTSKIPTADEIAELSDKDFEALQHKARTGAFV